ncbi:MAG TPA: HYExAFE family protein [Pirellulaceae bacterium]|jgi:hypothetical protein|nr:HYExAFE family protein [Pirellulaceae bacterium]
MVLRSNLYEAAFEAYLQRLRFPYLATDEARRAPDGAASLKSPDFVLQPRPGEFYVVDVKGRRFPSGKRRQQYWRNWTTREDVASLTRWEERFGEGASAWFVFAYRVLGERSPTAPEDLFAFRGELFGFVAIRLANYLAHARMLSPKWDTITMPTATFRRLAIPVRPWLEVPAPAAESAQASATSAKA